MQNRYVADIGDYAKLGLLRKLQPFGKLGVGWWLHPDQTGNSDGKHKHYLDAPDQWRQLDPLLFDELKSIRDREYFNVKAIERSECLPDAVFHSEQIPSSEVPLKLRAELRLHWLSRVRKALEPADILFLDPDNGFAPASLKTHHGHAGKSIFLDEVRQLAQGKRATVVYHHQTRAPGGHTKEIEDWLDRLKLTGLGVGGALRCRSYSPRAFFVLTSDSEIVAALGEFAQQWRDTELHSPRS